MFFSDRFLAPRPLLEAVRSEEPVVLLIDEIDRADEALEAVLLELLGEYQVSVPEIGTFTAKHAPYVILTSNNTRDLAAALKRRCLHLFLDYPSQNVNWRSCGPRTPDSPMRWLRNSSRSCADCASSICARRRASPRPSTGPAPWRCSGSTNCRRRCSSDTVAVVVKYDKDVRKALEALPRLVDPNAKVPAALRNGHAHRQDHGHSHDHGE